MYKSFWRHPLALSKDRQWNEKWGDCSVYVACVCDAEYWTQIKVTEQTDRWNVSLGDGESCHVDLNQQNDQITSFCSGSLLTRVEWMEMQTSLAQCSILYLVLRAYHWAEVPNNVRCGRAVIYHVKLIRLLYRQYSIHNRHSHNLY